MIITINDFARPLAVEGAEEVLDLLREITSGWTSGPADACTVPAMRLSRNGKTYALEAALRQGVIRERTALCAACSLVVDIAEALADSRPDMLCLHAAAVRAADGLVVFPSRRRAGKSTLTAYLASRGWDVFADDILPVVATGDGLLAQALGVASRLRLPLPEHLPHDFCSFVETAAGPADRRYRYLRPDAIGLAAYGERAPVKAFVFLDRLDDAAPASLHPAPRGGALQALLLQNFGFAASAGEILERLEGLTATAPALVLRYHRLDDAAALLETALAGARPLAGLLGAERALPPPPLRHGGPKGPLAETPLVRAQGLAIHRIDGRPFLVDDDGGAVFAADGLGALILDLLEAPIRPAEIVDLLTAIFPAMPAATIETDVTSFLAELASRRLALPAPPTIMEQSHDPHPDPRDRPRPARDQCSGDHRDLALRGL